MTSQTQAATSADIDLARRFAPIVRLSDNEPFLPSRVGVTVFDKAGTSPSAPLEVTFEPGVARVIEYAVWWDWDIQHLYELEHIWLKLDAADNVVAVEASSHGGKFAMALPDGSLPIEAGRVTLFSAPGKHAFSASAQVQLDVAEQTVLSCQELAGQRAILVNDMFRGALEGLTAEDNRAVKRHLQGRAFLPSFDFNQRLDLSGLTTTSWPELAEWIPARVRSVLAEVRAQQPLLKAVFLDSGDTLVNESTEVFDADGYVIEAGLIPGAMEMIRALTGEGYRLALVADGRVRSFENILGGHGIQPHFHAQVISESEGCEKPDARMFQQAMAALGLATSDVDAIVMVGNHLERDIGGANRLGIVSIWQSWSRKRTHIPANSEEVPRYSIRAPGELPALLADIERQMARAQLVPALTNL
jgi:phosphoglycolate phosphatase-like HAD superfamily hydrolase